MCAVLPAGPAGRRVEADIIVQDLPPGQGVSATGKDNIIFAIIILLCYNFFLFHNRWCGLRCTISRLRNSTSCYQTV